MTLILNLIILIIGLAAIVYAAWIEKDRRRRGAGLLAVGCYAFLLPIATGLAMVIPGILGQSDGTGHLDYPFTPILIVGFAVISLVAIPAGLRLLGLRLKGGIWFLTIWNGLGLLILGLVAWGIWTDPEARQCFGCVGEGYAVLFLAFIGMILLLVDFVALIGFLIAGLRRSRPATGRALLLGAAASAVQAVPLALRGVHVWDHISGVVVLAMTVAIAAGVFFVGRSALSPIQEQVAVSRDTAITRNSTVAGTWDSDLNK